MATASSVLSVKSGGHACGEVKDMAMDLLRPFDP